MSEFSYSGNQEVSANSAILFNETPVPCDRGFVRHREGTGNFQLSGWSNCANCPFQCKKNSINYLVSYGANLALLTTGTVGPISIGLTLDGTLIPSSVSTVTPTVTGAFFNVNKEMNVPVWVGCCQGLALINVTNQSIEVQNANLIITR